MKTNTLWKVFKIFASNIFSFGAFLENFKKGIKGILKNILVIILFLYLIGFSGAMYILIMNSVGNGLVNSGDIEKMPILILITALALVFFFGFVSAATNYYTGCGEEQFLSMPLRPVEIFGAKVGVTAITDAILGVVIILAGGIIYGIKAQLLSNPLFYLGLIALMLAVCAVCLFVIYGFMILILTLVPKFRNKGLITSVATILIFILVICYSMFSSRIGMMIDMGDQATAPVLQMIRLTAQKAPWLLFITSALSGNVLSSIIMLAFSALFIFVIVPLLAPAYIKTLNGFSDVKSKKISAEKAHVVISKEIKSNSVFSTLFVRDVRTIFREPSFFGNGPLMLLLVPVLFAVSFLISLTAAKNTNLGEIQQQLKQIFLGMEPQEILSFKYYLTLGFTAITVFMGNSTSIAATSFSREGKSLYDLKAMPIEPDTIVLVKFCHAFMYCIIAALIMGVFLVAGVNLLGLPLTAIEVAEIFIKYTVISLIISLVLIFTEMFIDTVNPKLLWENPTAAFKQNVNAVVSSFVSMGVVGLCVVLMFVFPKNFIGLLIIAAIFGVIAAPLGFLYFRYAVKKIQKM